MRLTGRYTLQHIWAAFQGFFSHSIKDEKSTLEYMELKAEFDDDAITMYDSEHSLTLKHKPDSALNADNATVATYASNIMLRNSNRTFGTTELSKMGGSVIVQNIATVNHNLYVRNETDASITLVIHNRITWSYTTETIAAGATCTGKALNKCGGIATIHYDAANNLVTLTREFST